MKQWILFLFSKTFLRTALFSVLGVLLVVAGVLWWMHSTTQHGKNSECAGYSIDAIV